MSVSVEAFGEFACFSRPEFKVERVSYDVMTPSAACGLLESVFWHPGLKWVVDRIKVCAPIRFINIRRNEVSEKISASKVQSAMKTGEPLYLATPQAIQQRATIALRDVRYVIDAHFEMTDKTAASDKPGKFQDIITRRLRKGQFYSAPYFGVREFAAHLTPCEEPPPCPEELLGEKDLGFMLHSIDYSNPADFRPRFFRAVMIDGVLEAGNAEVMQ